MTDKPLFIPLPVKFYEEFEVGVRTDDLRLYGKRWNTKNCCPGKPVILSKGFSKKNRMAGKILEFEKLHGSDLGEKEREDLIALYGSYDIEVARISITGLTKI